MNRGRPLGLSRHSSYRITIRCASNEATPRYRELFVRSPSIGCSPILDWNLFPVRAVRIPARWWCSSLPPASEVRRFASLESAAFALLRCGQPSPSYGWRSPSRRVPSSGARRRVWCFVGSIPPRAFRPSGAATFLNPREGLSGLRLGAPDSVFETTRACAFVANGHCVSV